MEMTFTEGEAQHQELNAFEPRGLDNLHPGKQKELAHEIVEPVARTVNVVVEPVAVPREWGTGKVAAVFKKQGNSGRAAEADLRGFRTNVE